MSEKTPTCDYQSSGVNIDAANELVNDIKTLANTTPQKGVLSGVGGFGALYELDLNETPHPILVSATDGVGTKLQIAHELNQHQTIGIDLVAMCANDILCQGAKPLFFLDYYATGQLNPAQAQDVLKGITAGCRQASMALVGGETAEMPGSYPTDEYDLAGFCVGMMDKQQMIQAHHVKPGDHIIGLASSGAHANGYSLIRQVISQNKLSLSQPFLKNTLGATLLTPTRIYVSSLLALQQQLPLHGLAHITGGGLIDNIPRILPPHTQATLDAQRWEWPYLFQWLQDQGQIKTSDMQKTFNLGIGMILIVDPNDSALALQQLRLQGEQARVIGQIETSTQSLPHVTIVE